MSAPETVTLDVDHLRSWFPALATPWALFDNAGGSVSAKCVVTRVRDYMTACMVQTGASHGPSVEATARVAQGHRAAELLLGASENEAVLGHSTTANIQLLTRALQPSLTPGDRVIVSNAEHDANGHPWRQLAERGIDVRTWELDRATCTLRLEDLEPHLDGRTRLVCFTHCSNIFGAIHDVAAITRRAHEVGARVCVDGVAYAPHRRVRVQELDVDFYLASLYKAYGPHIGVLYGKLEHLLAARGQYNECVPETAVPIKLEPGNPTHELAAGVPGIVEYLEAIHDHHFAERPSADAKLDRVFDLFAAHEASLVAPLLEYLAGQPRVRILGPASPDAAIRVPTVAFTVDGMAVSDISPRLDGAQVAIRHGHFHCRELMRALGLLESGGVARVSMVHYNTHAEVTRLISALDDALRAS